MHKHSKSSSDTLRSPSQLTSQNSSYQPKNFLCRQHHETNSLFVFPFLIFFQLDMLLPFAMCCSKATPKIRIKEASRRRRERQIAKWIKRGWCLPMSMVTLRNPQHIKFAENKNLFPTPFACNSWHRNHLWLSIEGDSFALFHCSSDNENSSLASPYYLIPFNYYSEFILVIVQFLIFHFVAFYLPPNSTWCKHVDGDGVHKIFIYVDGNDDVAHDSVRIFLLSQWKTFPNELRFENSLNNWNMIPLAKRSWSNSPNVVRVSGTQPLMKEMFLKISH